jgi:hypothetical protein
MPVIKSATYERKLEVERDQRITRERQGLYAIKRFGLDLAKMKPVSITSRATCDEDVVTE